MNHRNFDRFVWVLACHQFHSGFDSTFLGWDSDDLPGAAVVAEEDPPRSRARGRHHWRLTDWFASRLHRQAKALN